MDDPAAGRLRHALVDRLRERGAVRSAAVEAALRAVPRHLFLPGVPLADAYANDAVPVKYDAGGTPISAASQPSIVAVMLEQLDVRPGQRVLEIGAATGYNAALLAHLVGRRGQVTTVDLDGDLVAGARAHLAAAGHGTVRVVRGDGALGWPGGAPYDRIIATVGAHDLPPAWLAQLTGAGRLVVPLRLRGGVTRSLALERDPDRPAVWRAADHRMCGFMPLRGGVAGDPRRELPLGAGATLEVHQDQTADPAALEGVLDRPRHEVWTGVRLGGTESFEWLYLWLACALPNALSRMPAERDPAEPAFAWGTVATADGATLAYLAPRPAGATSDDPRHEVGVVAHGPGRERLAARVADEIRTWDRAHRTRPVRIDVQPTAATPAVTGQFTVGTGHHRIAITWQ